MLSTIRFSRMSMRVTALTLVAFLLSTVTPTLALAESEVTIPSGTMVTVSPAHAILPVALNVGDMVHMTVSSDVIIEGVVVIKAGAKATAEVIRSKNRNLIGIPAAIGLAMRFVEAVDGQNIALYGTKVAEGKSKMAMSIGLSLICCLLFALMKGGDAEIAAGTPIMTTVATTVTVTVQ